MQNTIRVIFICFMIVGFSGCATVTLDSHASKTTKSTTGVDTVHGSFYGFVWSASEATKCKDKQGFARIRTHTNIAYTFVSILSLGLYVPQNITWWCDGSQKDDQNEDAWIPPGKG